MKKKLVSVLLVAAMTASVLSGCGGKANNDAEATGGADTTDAADAADGEATDTASEAGHYTYAYTDSAPKTWSPTDWETNEAAAIQTWTTTYLYDFAMNETKDGYDVIPELAAAMPTDVTADYAGNETYGVPTDATEGYAWQVTLNQDAKWQDGTPITADDYVYSMQQFLNPDMSNFRASLWYTGSTGLANAFGYYNSNKAGEIGYTTSLTDLGYASIAEAQAAGYTDFGLDLANFWGLADAGTVSITDETEYRDEAVEEGQPEDYVSGKYMYDTYFASGMPYEGQTDYIFVGEVIEGATWDQVGFIKNDDYTITYVFNIPCSEFDFEYGTANAFLVKEDMYEANKQQTGDLTKSSYGTAIDNYSSYGPYKISEYQVDRYMKLEKNENWYGWTDGKHEGQFQTTDIDIEFISEHTTELSLFLQGNLTYVSLTADDMDQYANSDYLYYEPQSYTSCLAFNSNLEALNAENDGNVSHSMLAYQDFRKAISLSIDRADFCATCFAGHVPGFGLMNYVYVADPETGELYRDSEQAKDVLKTLYNTDDESQITGYDKDAATALFQTAYDAALADGAITADNTFVIDLHVYGSDDTYVRISNYINDSIAAACAGTDLEGKVSVNMVTDTNYYDNMKAGAVDMAISTWGGADMDPYSIVECYTDNTYKNEYGFDPYNEQCTINVNGEDITKSFFDWKLALLEGEYAAADLDTRNTILAGMELGLLSLYNTVPLYYRNVAVLYSQRTVQGSETYINSLVSFGGIRFMTYTMDDAEWATYCADNNNQLTY